MSILTPNRAEAVAALADPQRRELYCLASERPIGRDEAAAALGMPRSTAAVNLDRLADAGLLAISYERRSGRTGPGAGRPAKLYRAADAELAATIPERHYELAGELLAAAAAVADERGVPVRDALEAEAFAAGAAIGAGCADLEAALTLCGYAPCAKDAAAADGAEDAAGPTRPEAPRDAPAARGGAVGTTADLVLENCPFHTLAARHTALICGANLELVRGLATATGDERTPVLAPAAGRCCVEIRQSAG
ncbi:putative ArsR family transcriptional regulator [Microbacterium sp. BE35]|uniref:transcriptional regulator n=1 Tax=Microbacterium sp. BE35 TaxID=2817773 RepID=UPI0028615B04|nr:transcriptional regulator [Microbacterium sp. BE35]MDR7190370.1 putative ArsR family transcriptional regulator [Microbacterium sp. BE35]